MLVIQHIWSRWTKAARGANSPLKRPRLEEAYALPPGEAEAGQAWLHEVRADEWEGFAAIDRALPVSAGEWRRMPGNQGVVLSWRLRPGGAEISLKKDTYRQQTKFPDFLPSPLFVLLDGESARIDWNGRFRMSLFGSNRSSYYEQHICWLAMAEAPAPSLFLDAEPRKRIDFRTEIY